MAPPLFRQAAEDVSEAISELAELPKPPHGTDSAGEVAAFVTRAREGEVRAAAFKVLERLQAISRIAERPTDPKDEQARRDTYRLINNEKWWLGADIDAFSDNINRYRDMPHVRDVQPFLELQHNIRVDLLLQPELRPDNLPQYKITLDEYVSEMNKLLAIPGGRQ